MTAKRVVDSLDQSQISECNLAMDFFIYYYFFLVLTQFRIFKELKNFVDELVATLHALSTNNFIGLFSLIVMITTRG